MALLQRLEFDYSIDNAYVAGLKEDLVILISPLFVFTVLMVLQGFNGNQLVHVQTMYILGAVLGQIPFMFLFTVIPMYWLIPFLDVAWGVFTLLQYRVNSYGALMAYRFMVGWFEVR
jgi:hypothetical protein